MPYEPAYKSIMSPILPVVPSRLLLSARRLLVSLCWGIAGWMATIQLYSWLPYHHVDRLDVRICVFFQFLPVAAWEAAAFRRKDAAWLPALWLPRLVMALGLGFQTGIVIVSSGAAWGGEPGKMADVLLYAAVIAGIWHWHRRKRRDPFMLNLGLLSVTVFLLALIGISPLGRAGIVLGMLLIAAALCAGAWGPVQRRLWDRDAEAGPGNGPETASGTGANGGGHPPMTTTLRGKRIAGMLKCPSMCAPNFATQRLRHGFTAFFPAPFLRPGFPARRTPGGSRRAARRPPGAR
jgi:hypothetical protein